MFRIGEDTAWLVVLEKKGLYQTTGILENYGIDCETDVSLLDREDFSKLTSNGLKTMEGKKFEHWCNSVCSRVENMLTSSFNVSDNDSGRDAEDITKFLVHREESKRDL